MLDAASLLAAVLSLAAGGARDFDYARLSVLLPASDHVVICRVESLAENGAMVRVEEVLRGRLQLGPVRIEQAADAFADACMGTTSWTVGQHCVLFLRRSEDGRRLEVAFEGSGQHALPMLGAFDVATLRDVLVHGRVGAARLVELIAARGPRALETVSGQCREIGVAVDVAAAPVQRALGDRLIRIEAPTDATRWDALACLQALSDPAIVALPAATIRHLESAAVSSGAQWEAVSFLEPLARAGIATAQKRLAGILAGDGPARDEVYDLRGTLRFRFRGHAALVTAGVPGARENARRAWADLETDDVHARAEALAAWLDADPETVEPKILGNVAGPGRVDEVWLPLLVRCRSAAARQLLGAWVLAPEFEASRYQDALQRAMESPPAPVLPEEFRAGVAHRVQGPCASIHEIIAWIRFQAWCGGDAAPARAEALRWLRHPEASVWDRRLLLRALDRLEDPPLLERAVPSPAELDAATEALKQRVESGRSR